MDSEFFENINGNQYLWYSSQLALDEEESFELMREIAEHNAMFTNPEGVEKIRNARKNTYETPDDKFEDMVSDMFGRSIPKKGDVGDYTPMDPYLNMDLDEVNFTPIGGSE